MHSIIYNIFNSLNILALCLISIFQSETSLGISACIGTDMINVGFIYGFILWKVTLKESN